MLCDFEYLQVTITCEVRVNTSFQKWKEYNISPSVLMVINLFNFQHRDDYVIFLMQRNDMNPFNIHRDIHNFSLISFYLDIIPVSLISLPYPYSFLTLSILLYDSVYIFYCYTFVVRCCYLLVSAMKCGYSYNVHS